MNTKKSIQLAAFLCLFLGLGSTLTAQPNAKKIDVIQIKTSSRCGMCKMNIEKNLTLSKGVKSAVLDLETAIATIQYKPKRTNAATLRQVVANTGYDADEIQANAKAYENLAECCKKTMPIHKD